MLKVQRPRQVRLQGHRHRPVLARRQGLRRVRPRAAKAGAIVIDNTSYWRMDPDVPLVVPEVNPTRSPATRAAASSPIPNCSTIQMVVALKPMHDAAKIKRVVVSTYQSVSGAGKEAMDELLNQTKSFFVNQTLEPQQVHQEHRLQRHSPHRRLHGRRLDQGRMEDGGRDQEDPRPQDQGPRDLRARADLHRPRRGGQYRVRAAARRGRGARASFGGAGHRW